MIIVEQKYYSIFGIIIIIGIVLIGGCVEKECETATDCADRSCSDVDCRDNKCVYTLVSGCCGNEKCEPGETYEECVTDCPNCDDKNSCTLDEYDYHEQKCVNTPVVDVVCCGNGICETGETYSNCARDCPNCGDDNNCTKDGYDYHTQRCMNEPIIPCCGNEVCDEDAETHSTCPKDCPSCDDNNKLTADSFNYKTQKCENTVTHYFMDDFEEGAGNWVFWDGEGKPTTTAWSTIVEDGDMVLKGTEHNWANLNKEWGDYGFKFRFKCIKGSMHMNFRANRGGRYFFADGALKKQSGSQFKELVSAKEWVGVDKTAWHTIEIRGYGNVLNVYVDDKLLIKYEDAEDPHLSGRAAFETLGGSECLIDDIEIKVITEEDITYP
jgi:hypothetical protein